MLWEHDPKVPPECSTRGRRSHLRILKLLVKGYGYGDPSVEKAIDIARTEEMSKAQLETMAKEDASTYIVNAQQ